MNFQYICDCSKHKKMKTKIISTTVTILLLFGLALLNTSCTLIGFAIGYSIDAKNINKRKTEDIKRTEIDQLKIGRNVIIVNSLGDSLIGNYEGTSQMPPEKYLENYNRFKTMHADDLSIPMIGDTVDVYEREFGTIEKTLFIGLETNTIVLNHLNKKETFNIPITSTDIFVYYNRKPFLRQVLKSWCALQPLLRSLCRAA